MHRARLSFAVAIACGLTAPCGVQAQDAVAETIEQITIHGTRLGASEPDSNTMPAPLPAGTSDTASLLRNIPGVALQGAGGVSSLPAIHGMADDRLRVRVDGMDLIAACPNHMNPPLSYLDPTRVDSIEVFAGITPVSVGGDSIGGTIIVETARPEFAKPGGETLTNARAGAFYRSESEGGSLAASIAGENLGLTYTVAMTHANDYDAARKFKASELAATDRNWLDGDTVGSTFYQTFNQSLGLAYEYDNHSVLLQVADQHVADQGFPNQRMDMTHNNGRSYNLRHTGTFRWGTLDSRVYYEQTRHRMNFGEDKQYWYGDAPGMPMDSDGKNTGGEVTANVNLGPRGVLRTGVAIQTYRLDDWWPPSGTGPMMSPNAFLNIHDGERDRYDAFVEWERKWSQQWTTLIGVRSDTVTMDAGDVQGYSDSNGMGMMATQYLAESTAFNNRDHSRTDYNVDATLLARYTPADTRTFELGYARKSRSPNLYERYTWSTSGMVMRMVNFAGDGNGYVGNVDLDPEVAHTVSATADWHDARSERWGLRITPYLTYVDDYVDARRCSSANPNCSAANQVATNAFVYLQFVNQNARLYGADVSSFVRLAMNPRYGTFTLNGVLGYINGKNRTTDDNLYNVMPLNLKLSLEHSLREWTNVVEAHFVGRKNNVSAVRNELTTDSYSVVNLRSSYSWGRVRVDVGIDNLFDQQYDLPLGGAYVGNGQTMTGTSVPWGVAVPGTGVSFYTGLNMTL